MKTLLLATLMIATLSPVLNAQPDIPVVAVHIEKHAAWDCYDRLPDVGIDALRTTYDGVGRIDAFVVFYNYDETKGLAFGLEWPEAWGEGAWHDCGDMRLGSIANPHDGTSIIWQECRQDTAPLIAGWLTVTVTSPGAIEVVHSHQEGGISILNCDHVQPGLSEAMISLKGGTGGIKGDDPSIISSHRTRSWRVLPDSAGDVPTINHALRMALPGDTIMVAAGAYSEDVILRKGVVLLGSWDYEFTTRSLALSPSIIEGSGHNPAVRATFGADSSTVLDGFVVTNGYSKQGGGLRLRNGARPVLRNLIIHSNGATYGAGIFCHSASPTITDCLIASNEGDMGGAIYCTVGSSPVITRATIVSNQARMGAAIASAGGSSPTIERSIIAMHAQPSSIFTQDKDSGMVISCCDLWRNEDPQYGGITEEKAEFRDNISEDPQFRNPLEMDFTPLEGSPVLSVPNCGSIGSEHHTVPSK